MLDSSNNNTISSNYFNTVVTGIYLFKSNYSSVIDNEIYHYIEDCIVEENCTDNIFSGNICIPNPSQSMIPGFNVVLLLGIISIVSTILIRNKFRRKKKISRQSSIR